MWTLKLLLLYSNTLENFKLTEARNVLGKIEKGPRVRKIREVLDESTTILNVSIEVCSTFDCNEENKKSLYRVFQFWSSSTPGHPRKPFYRQVRPSCGGCWYTNDRTIEKSATAILFDNTRFSVGNRHNGNHSKASSSTILEIFFLPRCWVSSYEISKVC